MSFEDNKNISTTNTFAMSNQCFNLSREIGNTTISCPPVEFNSKAPFDRNLLRIFLVIIYSVIFLIGVPGNTLTILTIMRVKKMRSVKNLLIVNIAIGDLVCLLWCLTNSLLGLFVSWPYGEVICKYLNPLADVIIGNSVFTIVVISIERYRAIITPFSTKLTLRKTVFVIIILWIISYLFIGVPLLKVVEIQHGGFWVKTVCSLSWVNRVYEITYRLGTFVCVFLVPFSFILYCFVRIKRQLEENIRFAKTSLQERNTLKRAKKNQRLIKMLLMIFLSFTACFLPVNILLLCLTFFKEALLSWEYTIIVFNLAIAVLFLNSTINPIILYLLSQDFRKGYWQQIRYLCPSNAKLQSAINGVHRMSTFSSRLTSINQHNENPIELLHRDSNEQVNNESFLNTPDSEKISVDNEEDSDVTERQQQVDGSLTSSDLLGQRKNINKNTGAKKVSWC